MQKVTPRRVMIVEGNPDGHRLYYVSLLIRSAKESGCRVTVATTALALSSPEWSAHVGAEADDAEVAILNDFRLETVRRCADELQADHVVIPDGDSFVYELSKWKRWPGRSTVTAIAMREKGQPSAVPGMRPLMTLAKHTIFLLANLRPRVEVRILKSGAWSGFSMVPVVRDPVILTPQGSDSIQLPEGGGFWFGIVGSVGHRKNLPLVAAALASLNRADIGLIVAGQIDPGVLDLAEPHLFRIRNNGGQVEIIDRLLSDSEIDQLIVDLDCVVLAHSNDGPSGILGKAAAAGTRIVAAGAPTLRSDCRTIGDGAEWAHLRQKELSEALERAAHKPSPRPTSLASPADFASDLLRLRA